MVAVLAAFLVAAISVFPAFSAEDSSHTISVVNTVGINNIHIEINQYDVVDGQRKEINPNPTVLPAQAYHRLCEISNLANEAWIRVKVVYAENAPDVGENFLTISSDKWKKYGEYYYYTEPVPHDGVVEFFSCMNIPAEWDNDYAGKEITFTVYADAVQTQNFTPDFQDQDPWFGTIIEHRVHDDYIVPKSKGTEHFEIIYENGAEGLIKTGDDFFSNWDALMPGDVVSDKMLIKNNYVLPTTIYFRTYNIDESKLLDKLNLRIYTADSEIYNGSLSGGVKDEIVLAKLKRGEEIEVFYEITVPAELKNEFSLAKAKTEWIFRALSDNMPDPSPNANGHIDPNSPNSPYNPNSPDNSGNPDSPQYTPDYQSPINSGIHSIQTGDMSVILSVGAAVIIGAIALFIAIKEGGKKRENS